jgi:hypothetical protein
MDTPTRGKVDAKGRDDAPPALYDIVPDTTKTPTKPPKHIQVLLFILGLAGTLYFHHLLPTPISGSTPPSSKPHTKFPTSKYKHITSSADPTDDETYPLRPPTPWDISTDFPYPRTLEYDVQEGTWLRLDVHPVSGDVVFDMAGDIWCLPAGEMYAGLNLGLDEEKEKGEGSTYESKAHPHTRARPIILGVPYDSDPHFSPVGDKLVFRSDAELGVENIWVVPWAAGGCEAMDLRPGVGAGAGGEGIGHAELMQALEVRGAEGRVAY